MFNLLPQTEQARIVKQYKLRRLIVILSFLAASGVASFIFLIPSYLISAGNERASAIHLETVKKNFNLEAERDASLVIEATNQKLKSLKILSDKPVALFVGEIIKNQTTGVRLSRLVFTTNETKGDQIFVSGTATSRASLVSFADLLRANSQFADVILPVSNLAKESDIEFSITVLMNSKKQKP